MSESTSSYKGENPEDDISITVQYEPASIEAGGFLDQQFCTRITVGYLKEDEYGDFYPATKEIPTGEAPKVFIDSLLEKARVRKIRCEFPVPDISNVMIKMESLTVINAMVEYSDVLNLLRAQKVFRQKQLYREMINKTEPDK